MAVKGARRRGGQPRPTPMQGRPSTARPRPRPPSKGAAGRLQCDARKGGLLQGAYKGLPPATSPITNRGDGASRKGGRPLAGRLPAGKGNSRLRRGSNGGAEGERGPLFFSFIVGSAYL
ncbi:hypothetical protein B296_00049378 [Ensete ventricosum]|uniref:Uncharacterized protein n=1 Tax=Ensete ventricosum TaxID=4639 RepID=A0A426X4N8_ENSVE|nr:hypothetical protein B296_00049378 [Ensete ventricosum]